MSGRGASRAAMRYYDERWARVEAELKRCRLLTRVLDHARVEVVEEALAGQPGVAPEDWLEGDPERSIELGERTLEEHGHRVRYEDWDEDGRWPWGIVPPPELLTDDGHLR